MRILVVGAGGVGGYFGGRLAAAGRDVTFLVREARAARLARDGLRVRSPFGDIDLPAPQTTTRDLLAGPFDLVIMGCKAYDLANVIDDIAAAVGADTAILPLLNGLGHLDALDAHFGAERVLGGQCHIAATLDDEGVILHLNRTHSLTFGERDGSASPRMQRITAALSDAGFDARPSLHIVQDMWDKWVFLATLAGQSLTESGSTLTASMLRDIQRGGPIEADHIVGDMIERAGGQRGSIPLLHIAYAHLKAYEANRERTG